MHIVNVLPPDFQSVNYLTLLSNTYNSYVITFHF